MKVAERVPPCRMFPRSPGPFLKVTLWFASSRSVQVTRVPVAIRSTRGSYSKSSIATAADATGVAVAVATADAGADGWAAGAAASPQPATARSRSRAGWRTEAMPH